jgi:hypothetical protein
MEQKAIVNSLSVKKAAIQAIATGVKAKLAENNMSVKVKESAVWVQFKLPHGPHGPQGLTLAVSVVTDNVIQINTLHKTSDGRVATVNCGNVRCLRKLWYTFSVPSVICKVVDTLLGYTKDEGATQNSGRHAP